MNTIIREAVKVAVIRAAKVAVIRKVDNVTEIAEIT